MTLEYERNGFLSLDESRLRANLTVLFNLGKMKLESFHRSTTGEVKRDNLNKNISREALASPDIKISTGQNTEQSNLTLKLSIFWAGVRFKGIGSLEIPFKDCRFEDFKLLLPGNEIQKAEIPQSICQVLPSICYSYPPCKWKALKKPNL